MKVDLNSHFPHPVLSEGSDDFENGSFDLIVSEVRESTNGDVEVDYALSLVSADIQKLVMQGVARAGAFIRCQDTFYSELRMRMKVRGILIGGHYTVASRSNHSSGLRNLSITGMPEV